MTWQSTILPLLTPRTWTNASCTRYPQTCSTESQGQWKPLARVLKPSKCSRGAFATVISEEKYVDGVLCLARSLAAHASVCPLLLLYDDRSPLSPQSAAALTAAFGVERVFNLTSLMAQFNQSEVGSVHNHITTTPSQQPPHGRYLYSPGAEWENTFVKLWVWALPTLYTRVVVLDADLIVLRNIDELVDVGFPRLAAVPALGCSTRSLNSGLFVMRPAPSTFARLRRTVVGKVCERKITDQSVINTAFLRWRSLPLGFNVPYQMIDAAPRSFWDDKDVAIVHFIGEPKPWMKPEPNLRRSRRIATSQAIWRAVCGLTQ